MSMAAPASSDLEPEIIVVNTRRVMCDGGGALGHPRTWYEMGEADFVECRYCDRRFVLGGSEDGIEA